MPVDSFIPETEEKNSYKPSDSFKPLGENTFGLHPLPNSEENTKLWEHISRNYKGGKAALVRNSYFRAAMWREMPVKEAIDKGNKVYLKEIEKIGKIEEVSFRDHPVRYTLGEVANTLPFMVGATQEALKTGLILGGGFATMTS